MLFNYFYHLIYLFKRETIEFIKGLSEDSVVLSVHDFLELRNRKGRNRRLYSNSLNFKGVYLLHNISKDIFYVGKSNKVLDRINSHFVGRGNGDVYADYVYGDSFEIRAISLVASRYNSLNKLESDMIFTYKPYEEGYNKNRGSRS